MALLVPLLACAGSSDGDDPLSAELRRQVESFKAEGFEIATTTETLHQRSDLLWRWANAWALAGHQLPVRLPLAVQQVSQTAIPGREAPPALMREIDTYLRQLAIEDQDAGALGSTRFAASDPLITDSWATREQVYEAGSRPPQRGAVFAIAGHFMSDQGPLQNQDAEAEGFVSIRSDRAGADFESVTVPWSGMHSGAQSRDAQIPAFRLVGDGLEPGDTVTVVYGDQSGGSSGFRVQTMATERRLFPLYVDLDGSGHFFTPSWASLRVTGLAEVASLDVFVPSVVAVGESFELAVRSADVWYNRPTGSIPAFEVRLEGETVAQIPAGTAAVSEVPDLSLKAAGVYRFEVLSSDGALRALSNPIRVVEEPGQRVFWGELHAHTDFAEAQGTPEEFFAYAHEDARLDFFSLTEHDAWLDDREWQVLQGLADQTNERGDLVAFLGYEWTSARDLGGHHNVVFRNSDRQRVPVQVAPSLAELYRGLDAEGSADDVLVIPHAHEAGDWTLSDPELERLVEIYSMHGSFEWFGNLYLQNGWEVGFIAASDDHRSKPGLARPIFMQGALGQRGGLAAAVAPERSADAIFDALRSLSSYATSGERILLEAELNGFPMGSRQPQVAERRLKARVAGTSPIQRIDVIKNGEIALSRSYLGPQPPRATLLQVSFESSSEVFPPPRDNPRLYRFWDGTLTVEGGEIAAVSRVGLDNHYRDQLTVDEASRTSLQFRIQTRGRRDSFLLSLAGARSATRLRLELEPGREAGIAGRLVRQPRGDLPPAELSLRMLDLARGPSEHPIEVGPFTDRITFELVDVEGRMDQDLEWTDTGATAPGDYYYVRVTQLDGARAWSSPFWVGPGL